MGYLLKEALKTLCGINQWAYAVFWKIGQQNPKLLIWEEYYYGPESFSGLGGILGNEKIEIASLDSQAGDKASSLVNKMMMDHHVNIVGEGLIGRVAFTGSHQWIMSENCYGEAYPPQVLKEIYEQFSAGIQTVAAIPVLPHGVVQFGSYFKIKENMGFLNDVVSLVHQLAHVPGLLLSHNYSATPQVPLPESRGCLNLVDMSLDSDTMMKTSLIAASSSYFKNLVKDPLSEVQTLSDTDTKPYCLSESTMITPAIKSEVFFSNQSMNGVVKADEVVTSQVSSPFDTKPVIDLPRHGENNPNIDELFKGFMEENDIEQMFESQLGSVNDTTLDDIFELFGNNLSSHESASGTHKPNFRSEPSPASSNVLHSTTLDNLGSGIFSSMCSDHLLDAVVSGVLSPCPKEDSVSCCETTLTDNLSSSCSTNKVPLSYERYDTHMNRGFLGIPEYLAAKARGFSTSSSSKDVGSISQCSSICDPSLQKGEDVRNTMSVCAAYSKKPPKSNRTTTRKRLKPGENPRPRPKDRQMIQDRVKELREIIPNGAKCSIDALLERTIKHMLFLQGVTKHADKLKQTVESKILNNACSLSKDKFEGGATWAYEIGSHSMVCPIIVEDLNQPRQMLIEMVCEERGSFLEISDIIRGLGLTILKGTMQATNDDKIWTRFVVEAKRDVTRMEIFISLVRVLEQSPKNCDRNGNTVAATPFQRASSASVVQ